MHSVTSSCRVATSCTFENTKELSSSIPVHSMRFVRDGHDGPGDVISIDLVNSDSHLERATCLLNRMYAWRGYGDHHRIDAGSSSASFVASSGGRILGTLTLTADSGEGLAVDRTFPQEMAAIRARSRTKVCELTRFAFDSDAPAKPILAALFHTIFIYGSARFGSTDLLIEVAPRHSRFYEAMLGFERIGETAINASVATSSQLMLLKVADIRDRINIQTRCHRGAKRSLYPYFLSEIEECAIQKKVSGLLFSQPNSEIRNFG